MQVYLFILGNSLIALEIVVHELDISDERRGDKKIDRQTDGQTGEFNDRPLVLGSVFVQL